MRYSKSADSAWRTLTLILTMSPSFTETVALLFNTPIAPPHRKRIETDIPLVEFSRGRWADRRSLSDSAEGFALTVRPLHPILTISTINKSPREAILVKEHDNKHTET